MENSQKLFETLVDEERSSWPEPTEEDLKWRSLFRDLIDNERNNQES
jgi:hypothetical protein